MSTVQEGDYQKSKLMEDIYPDFVMMANAFGVPAKRVTRPEELRPAIRYCFLCIQHSCIDKTMRQRIHSISSTKYQDKVQNLCEENLFFATGQFERRSKLICTSVVTKAGLGIAY